jgi:hypothetical protein
MKKDTNTTTGNTLAHEIILKEEQNIGIFFAAFAIQLYFNKEMMSSKVYNPNFLRFFSDIDIYASQRVFVKNILTNKSYAKVVITMENLFLEYNGDDSKMPYLIMLSIINKGFLIRQIFSQTDQILSKYEFIEKFIGKDISHLDFDDLYQKMQLLPEEQQILVLSRLFILMRDGFEDRKKTVKASFAENVKRLKHDYESRGKTQTTEYSNLLIYEQVTK